MENKITIDRETLKAISSDTRLNLLKQLDRKKQTLSDLSVNLKLSNPTIKEHLDVLVKADLIKREESKRKWKYYFLTVKGKQLLKPNESRLFLALVVTIVVGIGFFLLTTITTSISSAKNQATPMLTRSMATADSAIQETASVYSTTPVVVNSTTNAVFPINNLILTIIILVVVVLLILYIKEKKKQN